MGRSTFSPRRLAGVGAAGLLVAAGVAALPTSPALAAAATTVGPAGHAYTASLLPGTTANFVVGTTTVRCNTSVNNGAVPAEPANSSTDGPVTSVLTPPSFTNNGGACPTNVAFTTARTVANTTNGNWTIGLQYDASGPTGTMTIPQGGVVTTISGLASCTVTVAPTAPVSFTGRWIPGTATSPPVLDFSAGASLPIKVTGGFTCPTSATTARFTASYAVTDTTDPTQQITVTPGPAPEPTDTTPSPEPTDPTPTPTPEPTDATPGPEPTDPTPAPTDVTPVPEPTDPTPSPEPTDATPAPEPTDPAPGPEPTEATPTPDVTD